MSQRMHMAINNAKEKQLIYLFTTAIVNAQQTLANFREVDRIPSGGKPT
jgi:hypothetical protein